MSEVNTKIYLMPGNMYDDLLLIKEALAQIKNTLSLKSFGEGEQLLYLNVGVLRDLIRQASTVVNSTENVLGNVITQTTEAIESEPQEDFH